MKNTKHSLLLSAAIFIAAASFAQTARITFTAPLFYPEGTAYHKGGKAFFVSSVKTGTIGKVDEKGMYTDFYADSALKSGYGMKVDEKRDKLWVCTGDANYSKYSDSATYKKMIKLIGLDLSTGKKTDEVDLSGLVPGKHFANDLTLDDKGNIYITDSYAPVIYKVDAQMKPSVLTQSDWFGSPDVGLNGILWHPKGFLIAVHNSNGQLFKIDLAQPQQILKIQSKAFFPGADGLLWDAAGNLVLVQNKGVNKVFQLASADEWKTAELKAYTLMADRFHHPTTATLKDGKVYVTNSKMNELTDPTAPPSKEFSLQEVRFVPAK